MSLAHIVRQTALVLGLVFTVIMTGQASSPDYSVSGQAISTAIAPLSALSEQTGATPLKTQPTVPMQYRSGGHVLGFTSEGVLIAGRDHLLKVSFVGAASVAPEAGDDPLTSATTPAMDGGSAESANAPSLARGPRTRVLGVPPITSPIGENAGAVFPPAAESKGAGALTEVHYRNLWPGIDLRYDGQEGIARSTYTLSVGAKVEAIRLAYNVATELTDAGSVTLTFATGTLHESAPIAWQEIDGKHQPVAVAFQQHENGELGFAAGTYDPAYPLTIDPTLTWNTFLGGAGTDVGLGIATDASGNVYVTGWSNATWGTPVQAYTGGESAFVAKLNGANGVLAWSTFLGAAGNNDYGFGIATDGSGNVYVTGYSTATWGAPVRAFAGGAMDAFVAKLNGATGVLTWHTFLGGAGEDFGLGIATDGSGNVYVTGSSDTTWGTPVQAYAGGMADAFVTKLNSATGVLTWHTFLGGAGFLGADTGLGIATDGSGNVYVTGTSGATWGAPVQAHAGGNDAFVAKLNGATAVLAWHTFLGGAGNDLGYGIATDGSGNVYVTGYSTATWGAPVQAHAGGNDAFAAKLNGATGVLTWSTFLGGAGGDIGRGIATDGSGNVYVAGDSTAAWGAPARAYTAGNDAFAAKLNATTGVLAWHTFLGGAGGDVGYGIATDGSGNIYVTGDSYAAWGGPVRAFAGVADAFVAKIAADILVPTGPNSFGCAPPTPAPTVLVLSSTPASAQPLAVPILTTANMQVDVAFNAFVSPVDIYVAVEFPPPTGFPPTGASPIQFAVNSNVWVTTLASLVMNSAAPVNMTAAAGNPIYNGPPPSTGSGTHTAFVVVVPAGTNPATFNFATSPHYTWCYFKTF